MEIDEFQHPDSIWTWKSGARQRRATLWLPYFQGVAKSDNGKRDHYAFTYNGGTFDADLKRVDCIMLYGATGELPVDFLDRLSVQGISLLIHRRNISKPYLFMPGYGAPTSDVLTKQILFRENGIRRAYVARTLIRERLRAMAPLLPISDGTYRSLTRSRSLDSIRAIEAQTTKNYWKRYFDACGAPGLTRRDTDHPINAALDAGSFFMFGVILRWVLIHRLSPWHGFLHEPVSYPALCYDLMEPARYMIESAVMDTVRQLSENSEKLTAQTLSQLKHSLEETVYVAATRQNVARKGLIHGYVLALRAYLLGETARLILPVEGRRSPGRPLKVSYRLPGARTARR